MEKANCGTYQKPKAIFIEIEKLTLFFFGV